MSLHLACTAWVLFNRSWAKMPCRLTLPLSGWACLKQRREPFKPATKKRLPQWQPMFRCPELAVCLLVQKPASVHDVDHVIMSFLHRVSTRTCRVVNRCLWSLRCLTSSLSRLSGCPCHDHAQGCSTAMQCRSGLPLFSLQTCARFCIPQAAGDDARQ